MKFKKLTDSGCRNLLIIFAGWGMDHRPFTNITLRNYDIAIAYDYTDGAFDSGFCQGYDDITVIAWSFGVIAADIFFAKNSGLPVSLSVAVNGTLYPVDDSRGIPEAIFRGTLDGLSEQTLMKFYRRMCGGAESFKRFMASKPERPITSLREELEAIAAMKPRHSRWDIAVIYDNDRIIPPLNQVRSWQQEGVRTIRLEGHHLPDFFRLITMIITDKTLVAKRFLEAKPTYDANAIVQRETAARLSDVWRQHQRVPHNKVIEIGAGTGLFTNMYTQWLRPASLELWDLMEIPESLPGTHRVCDGEKAILFIPDKSVDAIASASALQWFNSPQRFIAETARVLRSGGVLAISTFGPENFREIRRAIYPSLADLKKWLDDNDMEILHAEESLLTQEFESSKQMLEHFRSTGVNAIADTNRTAEALRLLRNGIRTVTYHPILLLSRKR